MCRCYFFLIPSDETEDSKRTIFLEVRVLQSAENETIRGTLSLQVQLNFKFSLRIGIFILSFKEMLSSRIQIFWDLNLNLIYSIILFV